MLKRYLISALITFFAASTAGAGQITLYTSMPKNNAEQLIDAFEKSTPGVKVQLFRAGSGQILNKLQGEFAARQVRADVVMLADEVSMTDLKRDNRLMTYRDAPVKDLPKGSYDPGFTYFGTRIMTVGIIYNTRRVQQAPTSWAELVAGNNVKQTVMPSPLYSGAQLANLTLLTEMPGIGWPYFEKMAKEGVQTVEGNGEVRNAVAEGSKSYGMVLDYMAIEAAQKGSPVAWVAPKEGVVAFFQPIAILQGAANVEDAKKFINFLLSRQGQELAVKQGYRPLIANMAPPAGFPAMDKMKVIPVDAAAIEKAGQTKKRFDALFGG
ncbi:MAG: ABC transporter substrate-binding protein [Burkholderiales bacterium]|nr:ABC transporter substrate-binding protein [Burkholderiales bacterium]MDP2399878.1 ABC transporter substrate-binding protein [Burkholderiales bacterium]